MPDSKVDLEALKALEKHASQGEWFTFGNDHCVGAPANTNSGTGGVAMCGMNVRTPSEIVANAALIAAMRNALPELIRLAELGSQLPVQPAKFTHVAQCQICDCSWGVNGSVSDCIGTLRPHPWKQHMVVTPWDEYFAAKETAIKPSAQVQPETFDEAWIAIKGDRLSHLSTNDILKVNTMARELWETSLHVRNAAIASRGQGGKIYDDGIRDAAKLLRTDGVLLPVVVDETHQDRIIRFALAFADKLDALAPLTSPTKEGE